jgi:predicted transcriptional regulator
MVSGMTASVDLGILAQPTRRRIVEHLRMLPGDHFRSIVRTLHLSLGATRHHLTVLAKRGLVRSERIGGKLRYFAVPEGAGLPLNDTFKQYWKYRDLRVRVWSAVLRSPEVRPSDVALTLGVSRQLVAYHLKCLSELGLVVRSHGRYRAVNPQNRNIDLSRSRGEHRSPIRAN